MKKILLAIMIASTSLFACKSSQSGAMGADRIEPANSKPAAQPEEGTYDMIISFISKGAGTDRVVKPKIDEYMTAFNEKHGLTLNVDKVGWGREGEVDYHFDFENLSTAQKKEFISEVKAIVGSSDIVFVSLNKKAVHKR
ncbi:MAG: hypothetical protein KDD41_10720 [Flavobacteriales bacterium]|nr:hypothetical protein [Flavobacteriales bacterium]